MLDKVLQEGRWGGGYLSSLFISHVYFYIAVLGEVEESLVEEWKGRFEVDAICCEDDIWIAEVEGNRCGPKVSLNLKLRSQGREEGPVEFRGFDVGNGFV